MSGARRTRWGVAAATLAVAAALTPAPVLGLTAAALPASHHHAPSAGQIQRSRGVVASQEHQVAVLAASISRANAKLVQLRTSAEVAFENYDEARLKLVAAQRAVTAAHHVLNSANHQVARGQAQVTQFATTAYETGGLTGASAYIGGGGPATLVRKLGAIDAISLSQHTTLQRLQAAQIYQGVVSRRAEGVQASATAADQVATRAKAVADAALRQQSTLVANLHQQRVRLASLLAASKARVGRLERARVREIRRAQAAAARKAAQHSGPGPYQGSSGNLAGTASAATELAALHVAETQIGKPYVWAAAGPNSYDCSGLVLWAYAHEGITLLHWTGDQWNEGAHVSKSELRPGDLVFFATNTSDPATIHHVGLYVGNGEMLDAPYTGVDVRYDSMERPDYIGAVRPYQQ